jgi:hypothetical protein
MLVAALGATAVVCTVDVAAAGRVLADAFVDCVVAACEEEATEATGLSDAQPPRTSAPNNNVSAPEYEFFKIIS